MRRKVFQKIEHLRKRNISVEPFHSAIKGIHLALELKTSFANSTPATGSSTEFSSQKPRVPTDSRHQHRQKREEETCTQKGTKQSLSDYA
jgi:hypothetical protein